VKTISLKKVSAVAVASLGFGLLSVVPAQATVSTDEITNAQISSINVTAPTAPTAGAAAAFTLGITAASTITTGTTDLAKIKAIITAAPTGAISSFTGAFVAVTNWIDSSSGAGVLGAGLNANTLAANASVSLGTLTFTPSKAGVYNISFYHDQDADNVIDADEKYNTATITVGAASGYSNDVSTIYTNSLTDNTAATAATTASATGKPTRAKAMSATRAGTLTISLNRADLTSAHTYVASVEATVSGSGYVDVVNAAAPTADSCYAGVANSPLRSDSSAASQQVMTVYVCSDGTAGPGKITVKVTDTAGVVSTLGTVDILFTDTATALSLGATNYTIAPAGGANLGFYTTMGTRDAATKIPATILKTTDTAGNAVSWTTNTPSGLSSSLTVLTGGTCAVDSGDATYGSGGAGFYNCYVTSASSAKSGDTATITWRVLNADGVTYTSLTPVTYTIGGAIAKEVLTLDKTAYAPGQAMTLTVTATDAAGKPAYDGQAVFAAQTTSSMTITGLPTTTLLTKGGTAITTANTLFAPSTPGAFTIFGTGTDAAATKLSVAGSVDNGTDAIKTSIASLNAKIVALNALIAKIMKRLNIR
jgi:hypothetical protein